MINLKHILKGMIIFTIVCISSKCYSQNSIKKEALTEKVWTAAKGNPRKVANQSFKADGGFSNGSSVFKGRWEWKNDSTLSIKYSGSTWEQVVRKLNDNEFVMVWKNDVYSFVRLD